MLANKSKELTCDRIKGISGSGIMRYFKKIFSVPYAMIFKSRLHLVKLKIWSELFHFIVW